MHAWIPACIGSDRGGDVGEPNTSHFVSAGVDGWTRARPSGPRARAATRWRPGRWPGSMAAGRGQARRSRGRSGARRPVRRGFRPTGGGRSSRPAPHPRTPTRRAARNSARSTGVISRWCTGFATGSRSLMTKGPKWSVPCQRVGAGVLGPREGRRRCERLGVQGHRRLASTPRRCS